MKLEENAEKESENQEAETAPAAGPRTAARDKEEAFLLAMRRLKESPLRLFLKDK